MKNKQFLLGISLIILAASARLIKHPANFSPVGSIALFGGAVFVSKYWKFLIPVLALYFSDFLLNNTILRAWYPDHEGIIFYSSYMSWSYVSFIGAVLIGQFLINKISISRVLGGAVAFTVLFFVVSNFGVWASTNFYPKNVGGLISCYAAGLPFVKSSLAGNVFYSTVLFGGYYLINQRILLSKTA